MDSAWFAIIGIVIGTVLGWLLGLLNYRFERYLRRRDLKGMILSELQWLSVTLAVNCFTIQMHLGEYDRSDLIWVKKIISRSKDHSLDFLVTSINNSLKQNDEQILALANSMRAANSEGLALKSLTIPLIESSMKDLDVFSTKFQKELIKVYGAVKRANEEVELSMSYFKLTFVPEAMNANAKIINRNINGSYKSICKQFRFIVEDVDKILSENNS